MKRSCSYCPVKLLENVSSQESHGWEHIPHLDCVNGVLTPTKDDVKTLYTLKVLAYGNHSGKCAEGQDIHEKISSAAPTPQFGASTFRIKSKEEDESYLLTRKHRTLVIQTTSLHEIGFSCPLKKKKSCGKRMCTFNPCSTKIAYSGQGL
jgi:hypothetical protein